MAHIHLDCDGVLLNWEAGFRKFAMRRLDRDLPATSSSWDLATWLGVSKSTATSMIHEFNHCPLFGFLDAIDGAVPAIRHLARLGHRLTVISSCSANSVVRQRRQDNLERLFGMVFDNVTCLDLGESKRPWLEIAQQGVWVEDNYHGALDGHLCGRETYMLRQPHNRQWEAESSIPQIKWASNWDELRDLIDFSLVS